MKNQYIGDIGDYGKYGLLRFLLRQGIKIGVNWYLTGNDESEDGKFTGYLNCRNGCADALYDRELFLKLQPFGSKDKQDKKIQDIENADILPGAAFFDEKLSTSHSSRNERRASRTEWHERAKSELLAKNPDLIFADPDNGTTDEKKAYAKNGEKYATVKELKEYYCAGKNVVYYCHKARRSPEHWQKKMLEMNSACHDARIAVLTFHRGTNRSYIFCIHPEEYDSYNNLIDEFLQTPWGTVPAGGKKIPFSREM